MTNALQYSAIVGCAFIVVGGILLFTYHFFYLI